MSHEQTPKISNIKEIAIKDADILSEDVGLLLDIIGFDEWSGPFMPSHRDGGIQIDLKMDKASEVAMTGSDTFSSHLRYFFTKAYSDGYNRIFISLEKTSS
ncbi:hypothetical protein [Teredinibacter purpureus]|uniref:hypothetical protein n=1 Tax=Teredinibacter purpureus TaxID=2731756 RepID=UPI0005F7CE0F|nr:hypothetical protein [Teredinibacter purpureus]